MTENILPESYTIYYIGPNDCRKVTCNKQQEWPEADDAYCLGHSLEHFHDNL